MFLQRALKMQFQRPIHLKKIPAGHAPGHPYKRVVTKL